MNNEVKQAILLAIDALQSYGYKTFIDDATGNEWEQLDIDDQKVRDALKALQALDWEEK